MEITPKAIVDDAIEVLKELAESPDPYGDRIEHYLLELSIAVEDGAVKPERFKDEFEKMRELAKSAKSKVWDGLLKGMRSIRKDFPKSHWWWYPEEW